jgi:branched-chain amino acid transport system substrate-binding protein
MKKLLLSLSVAAAAALGPQPSAAQEPIRIGAIVARTGPGAFLGEPQAKTFEYYIKKINEAGGLLGRPLQLVLYDDKTDANTARTFASRLVEEDKVVAVLGASTTGNTLAIMPVFEEAKVPLVSMSAGVEITEPVRKFIFKTPHTDRMVCQRLIEDMAARGFKKIAILSGTDGAGKSMQVECTKAGKEQGIEIAASESFNPRDTDMTPQLTKLKDIPGLQAIMIGGFGQPLAVATRNYGQLDIKIPHYQAHGAASKTYIDLSGAAAEGVRLPSPALVVAEKLRDDDRVKKVAVPYKQTYEAQTGQPVSTFGGYGYDALMLVVNAIKTANSADPARIRDALENTKDFVGVTGIFNMSPTDHLGLQGSALYMVEIRNANFEPLR